LKVNYNHNITSSSNSYSGTLNLNVVELTSSAYKIDATNNYIFTGMVTDETTIKNNISINMGSFEVSNGKVTVSYGGSVIKTFTIVNYTSSTYNLNLGYIYTGTSSFDLSKINVTGGEKAYKNDKLVISYDGITLKEIPVITLTSTKYDLNNEYILTGGADYTDGIIAPHATITSENGKVVIRYNSTVLKEYVISDFADQNFYNCVVDIYNSKKGTSKTYREMLSDDELLQIGNSLTCVNKGIKNVTGINKLPDLLYINLSQNHISAINLAKYTNLKTLDLTSNALTTINVSENVNLDTLKLGANSLVSIDVAKNSKLVTLELNNNRLLSIGLENNVLLQTLNISSNGLTKIDGSKLEKLNVLNLGSNDLSEIDLTKNLNLTTLDISNNKFTSLDISYLKNLTSLNISENQFVETVQGYKGDKITLGSSVKLPSSLNFAKLVYTSKPTISIANGSEATLLDVGTVQMVGVSSSGYQIATTITVLPDVLDFEENIKPDGDFIYLDPETTVKTVSELIETNGTIVVVNKNGDVLGADKYVGTTAKIKIKFSNEEAVYTVIVKGDLTGDGVIKINDISKLYQSLKEKITLSAIEFYAGDVAEDNVIKINDVSKLYQFLKKKISEL